MKGLGRSEPVSAPQESASWSAGPANGGQPPFQPKRPSCNQDEKQSLSATSAASRLPMIYQIFEQKVRILQMEE